MDSLVVDFEKTLKRQKAYSDGTLAELEREIALLRDAISKLEDDELSVEEVLKKLSDKISSGSQQLVQNHRDLATALLKCSKSVEKRFKVDLDNVWNPQAFSGKSTVFHVAILEHFIREGQFDVAYAFAEEAGVPFPESLRAKFEDLFQIVSAIREKHDLSGALRWAAEHNEELEQHSSVLEFRLHKLMVIDLLINQHDWQKALAYVKLNLQKFQKNHLRDIQRLVSLILYMYQPEKCPYPEYLSSDLWAEAEMLFSKDACQLLGLPADAPLYTAVGVGTSAMPTIIKMSSILKDKSGLGWSAADELPVEVPLQDNQRFHSIFACPVSKEQATAENPPMMMACGHVICKESLNRLCKSNTTSRFKCPYCPTESTSSQAMQIYF